jgi:pimeloyl-ACP methyl ester carboxylesterase
MDKRAVEKPRQQLSKLIIYRVLLAISIISAAVFFALWRGTSAKYIKIGYPEGGDRILATDYADRDNWMTIAQDPDKPADVFFIYPTSWRAKPGEFPISGINNPEMRHWAKYYLDTRGSAFETAGNMYAPFYRQLDASFALSQETIALTSGYMAGVPYTDIKTAFDYYIKHFNNGRPFIIAGHSQGSAMGLLLLIDYMKERPEVYKRMVAAYLIGIPVTQAVYDTCPWLKAAQQADDTGVIISYNTQAEIVDAPGNPLSNKNAVLINPISWQINNKKIEASQSKGSVAADEDTGEIFDLGAAADARIDQTQGVIITSVDRHRFSSAPDSRGYFPLGVFHENDIPLFYYDLRANAELRAQTFLEKETPINSLR